MIPQVDSRVHLMAAHLGRFKTLAFSSSEGANHAIIECLASMSTQQDENLALVCWQQNCWELRDEKHAKAAQSLKPEI